MVIDQWIEGFVGRQVMKIRELTAAGASQLAVDLEYLRKAMKNRGSVRGDRWKKQFGILGNGSVSKPIVPLLVHIKIAGIYGCSSH